MSFQLVQLLSYRTRLFLSLNNTNTNATQIDEDDIPDVDSILKWCSSLVRRDELSGTLSLSHFTVEEFLEYDQLLETPELRCFHMRSNPSEPILAKVCLTYLNFEQPSRLPEEEKPVEVSFFEYASVHWLAHAEREDTEEDDVLFDLMCRLFNPVKSPNFILWLQKYWTKRQRIQIPRAAPTLNVVRIITFFEPTVLLLPRYPCLREQCHFRIFEMKLLIVQFPRPHA